MEQGDQQLDKSAEEDGSFKQGKSLVLPGPEDDVTDPIDEPMQEHLSRAGRTLRPTTKWLESLEQQKQGIVALLAVPWEVFHDEEYSIPDNMENPIVFLWRQRTQTLCTWTKQ